MSKISVSGNNKNMGVEGVKRKGGHKSGKEKI
ncbi:hypothetical protein BJV92_003597 [Clostridium beijerinckii]|jgi:hypothetical protein|nr:hypothetical protein [Clostridium beijerinckii]NRY63277.1 hypothetical protein [Clostridium beijerinckii]